MMAAQNQVADRVARRQRPDLMEHAGIVLSSVFTDAVCANGIALSSGRFRWGVNTGLSGRTASEEAEEQESEQEISSAGRFV